MVDADIFVGNNEPEAVVSRVELRYALLYRLFDAESGACLPRLSVSHHLVNVTGVGGEAGPRGLEIHLGGRTNRLDTVQKWEKRRLAFGVVGHNTIP